jgi:hypothetical protein
MSDHAEHTGPVLGDDGEIREIEAVASPPDLEAIE